MTSTPIRRPGLLLLSLWLPFSSLRAEEPALRELLRDALYTEEVTRDPEKAAKQYEELLARHDAQKTFAAAALFRLAEVRRKQDRKDDAIQLYQWLIAEFPGAETECKLARENLAALGGKLPELSAGPVPGTIEDQELASLEARAVSSPDVLLDSATILAEAANRGHAKVVKRMLDAGCKPYQGSALENAAANGNLEIVKLLTSHPDPVPPKTANQALHAAIQNGRPTVLDYLLGKGLKPGNVMLANGEATLLAYALMNEKFPSAEILMKHGADLNEMVTTDPGQGFEGVGSPLHLAVSSGKSETVKWLLEKGAKPGLPNLHFGLTPLHYAAKSEHPGALDIMKQLLAAGAEPNIVSNDREAPDSLAKTILLNATPLETAIASHSMSLEKTKLLLEHKADPNRKDSRVSAMLALANGMDDPNASDLVQLLGEAGFRMTDPKLMETAINHKNPKMIELLLKYGADPNTKDRDGNTFLAAACIAGDADRVRMLLKNGADPKQAGLLGALIRRGPEAIPMIRILLEAGADPNALGDSKRPPVVNLFDWDFENKNSGNVYLHSDKRSDQAKLLGLLLKHGLDPNTTYSEFVRSATSSSSPSRSGGNPGSPFLEDTTETKTFPKSLLMMVVEMEKIRKVKNVDMIGMLLDAGAKPSHEFPELFDFVAKGADTLPIAKALLPFRPPTLKLDRTGYFMNWNPQVKRLVLDEILNPVIREKGGVHLVFLGRGGIRTIIEPNQAVPPTAELLLAELGSLAGSYTTYTGKREDPVITRVRRDAGGQWSREPIDWQGDAALPDLIAGDIIELDVGKLVSTDDDHGNTLESLLAWHLRKRVSFPVTIEIGGKPREIKLRGDLLSYDPTKNEAPLLNAGHLAMLFLPSSADTDSSSLKPDSILTVRRQGVGDVRMDLAATGAQAFKLQSGDHLILPESVMETEDEATRPIRFLVPDFSYSRIYRTLSDTWINRKPTLNMPTLIQVLADAYAPRRSPLRAGGDPALEARLPELSNKIEAGEIPVVIPHPDFSRIRIKRIGGDRKEIIQEVDLSEAIRSCTDDTSNAEARKADVALFPGDLVELPLKTSQLDQAWKGFTAEEERFFQKALGGTVMVRKQDGIINPVAISYHQPDWQKTPHGLIPLPPQQGVASPRLFALTGMNGVGLILKRDGHELRSDSDDPLLRDGDEIRVEVHSPPMPIPAGERQRRRVVLPPPSSN
jgi:ankyrin repeat protein